jgi:site-specific recombinase XerC
VQLATDWDEGPSGLEDRQGDRQRIGMPELHQHAFRHSRGVELPRRSGENLWAVQEQLRHSDIQTTTVYTRLTQYDL